ncbi:PLDc_N domain-containing protein [Kocuria coralli]|uniref:PLDc_N domain-containing protein n=1 Tax=Kocuria coralli TaxID=1461025 RepID=A0A5J5L019_9MICC|nr:PLD nuclease N-terminal domain-containing protein [Kocuria coralli]KAA9395289.1 PLDc_N domain-containing protein [Kocuria coralli]
MIRAIAIIGAAALAVGVIIYSFFDCLRSDPRDIRGIKRGPWIAVILLLPVIGGVLWLTLGRPRYAPASSQPSRGRGPDDDPNFLRQIDEKRRTEQAEAELEEWERQQKDAGIDPAAAQDEGGGEDRPDNSDDDHPDGERFDDDQPRDPDDQPGRPGS